MSVNHCNELKKIISVIEQVVSSRIEKIDLQIVRREAWH